MSQIPASDSKTVSVSVDGRHVMVAFLPGGSGKISEVRLGAKEARQLGDALFKAAAEAKANIGGLDPKTKLLGDLMSFDPRSSD